jgi:hypothetical protein
MFYEFYSPILVHHDGGVNTKADEKQIVQLSGGLIEMGREAFKNYIEELKKFIKEN